MTLGSASTCIADIEHIFPDWEDSYSVTYSREKALSSLEEAFAEANETNWDGYRAHSASVDAYLVAQRVLESLPASVPDPETDFDPDGDAIFEWMPRPGSVFVMSIGQDDKVAYALRSGQVRRKGIGIFSGSLPSEFIHSLLWLLDR